MPSNCAVMLWEHSLCLNCSLAYEESVGMQIEGFTEVRIFTEQKEATKASIRWMSNHNHLKISTTNAENHV